MKPYGINGTMESIADTHHITLFNNCIEELSKVDQFIVVSLSGDQCSGWIALKK